MAIRPAAQSIQGNYGKAIAVSWAGLTTGDTGAQVGMSSYPYKSVQVSGSWGIGATLGIQASLDGGVTWDVLRDQLDNPIEFTANGVREVYTTAPLLRPAVTGGSPNVLVNLYASKEQ